MFHALLIDCVADELLALLKLLSVFGKLVGKVLPIAENPKYNQTDDLYFNAITVDSIKEIAAIYETGGFGIKRDKKLAAEWLAKYETNKSKK